MKSKLIALTFVVLFLISCTYTDFDNCMDFCVEELDGRCSYNTDWNELTYCDEETKKEVGFNCFEICTHGDLDGGET